MLLAASAPAEVRLPNIISDGMVLQRDVPVPIWGKAAPGESVTVSFAGRTRTATAGGDGRWTVHLDPMPASSEPRRMLIEGGNRITIDDVLVGEVWLTSGDMGMEFNLAELPDEEKRVAFAQKDNRLLRMYCVAAHYESPIPCFFKGDRGAGEWSAAREFIPRFEAGEIAPYESHSAVAFFFAMKLQKELGVPVAVLDSSVARKGIDRWISDEGYRDDGPGAEYARIVRYRPVSEQLQGRLLEMFRGVGRRASQWADKAEAALANGEFNPFPYSTGSKIRALNSIYLGMIHPMTPYAVKGVVWYHGNTDVEYREKGKTYRAGLSALIGGWRKSFKNPRMPFMIIMLAPNAAYSPRNATPAQQSRMCDNVWQGQLQAADGIAGVHAIPIHDTVIPKREKRYFRTPAHKMDVGLRVADNALKLVYGKRASAGGLRFAGAERDGNRVIVSFKGIEKGLESRGGEALGSFGLSADGKTFVGAKAVIEGDRVVVTADGIPAPGYVRMGWKNDASPRLRDRSGIPAYPFPAQRVK